MSAYLKPVPRKCSLCGKRFLATHATKSYCRSCSHFHRRMECSQFTAKAKKGIMRNVRKYGYTCDYSGVSLEIKDITGPWHYNFSFPNKRYRDKVVLAAALFSVMKEELTKSEFRYYVLQLHDNRIKHTKIKRRPIINWNRLDPGACRICGQTKPSIQSKYCPTCAHTAHRLKWLRLPAKTKKAIWDYIRQYGYICYYTGMELDQKDPHSPWYISFDHCNPRDPGKVVITSYLVNEMKNDLTEKEFWYYIAQLADHFRKGTPVRKIKLKYWSRHYIP